MLLLDRQTLFHFYWTFRTVQTKIPFSLTIKLLSFSCFFPFLIQS